MNVNLLSDSVSTSNVLKPQATLATNNNAVSDGQTEFGVSGNKINLSDIGKSISKLDALNSELERFVESKVPANVIESINKTEEELNGLIENGIEEDSAQFKELSKKLEQQYSNAQSYLTKEEQTYLNKLDAQIEGLESSLEGILDNDENTFYKSTELAFSSANQDSRETILSLLGGNNEQKGSRTLAQTFNK